MAPFASEAQRRYLWAKHPDVAQRWADENPGQKNLPSHAHGSAHETAKRMLRKKSGG